MAMMQTLTPGQRLITYGWMPLVISSVGWQTQHLRHGCNWSGLTLPHRERSSSRRRVSSFKSSCALWGPR